MADSPESEIIHRELEIDGPTPSVQIAETVAEINGKEATDLATMYECVDGVLDHIFSNPPAPEAQMQVTFSYETFRITIEQDGAAKFVKTGEVE